MGRQAHFSFFSPKNFIPAKGQMMKLYTSVAFGYANLPLFDEEDTCKGKNGRKFNHDKIYLSIVIHLLCPTKKVLFLEANTNFTSHLYPLPLELFLCIIKLIAKFQHLTDVVFYVFAPLHAIFIYFKTCRTKL